EKEGQHDATGQQPPEGVLRGHGDVETAPQYRHVQPDQEQHAQQSELLGQHRQDEVGVALRNEVELRLRPVQPALALYAAGTDGDLRLDDVVAGSGRIAVGVEEGQDAVLLVRHGDEDPPGRRRQYQGAGPGEDQLPGDTSQQDDEHPGHHDHQRRASVILHQHQPHRQQDNRGTYQQILEARRQRTTGQIPGQQHGHQELLHLGGLETREAGEVEPGGGAVGLDPEQQHDDQQDNAPQI